MDEKISSGFKPFKSQPGTFTRIGLFWVLFSLLVFLFSIFSIVNFTLLFFPQAVAFVNEALGQEILGIAKASALNLDAGEVLSAFQELRSGKEDKTYGNIYRRLQLLRSSTQVESIYLVVESGDNAHVIVEVSPRYQKGSLFKIDKTLKEAFQGQPGVQARLGQSEETAIKSAFVPVYGPKGKVIAVLGVDASSAKVSTALLQVAQSSIGFFLVLIAISILFSIFISQAIVNPIRQLHSGMHRIGKGELKHRVPVRSFWGFPLRDEMWELTDTFNKMVHYLYEKDQENMTLNEEKRQYMILLEKKVKDATRELLQANQLLVERENQRQAELKLAQEIQHALFPVKHSDTRVEIETKLHSAREIGGDFYNFFYIDPSHLAVMIGDVSGRGIPAALLMSMTLGILHETSKGSIRPAEILKKANATLVPHMEEDFEDFASVFFAILDFSKMKMSYSKAGHELPVLYRGSVNKAVFLEAHGPFLGIFHDASFEERTLDIGAGDLLVLYTDGISSARGNNGQFFGEDNLLRLVETHGKEPAKDVLNSIYEEVTRFNQGQTPEDDMALLVLKIKQTPAGQLAKEGLQS